MFQFLDGPELKIHKAAFLMARLFEKDLQGALGLSLPQFMLLMTVMHKDKCSQAEIAKTRGLTEAAVSRMADTVLEKKWMTREENPENRREHILKLTKDGEIISQKAVEIVKANMGLVFAELTEDERVTLDRIMDKILQSVYTKTHNYA